MVLLCGTISMPLPRVALSGRLLRALRRHVWWGYIYVIAPSWYCAKGCAQMGTSTVIDRTRFCAFFGVPTHNYCVGTCGGASRHAHLRAMCRYGCDFWLGAGLTAAMASSLVDAAGHATIPSSYTIIDAEAFRYMTDLARVSMPAPGSITTIYERAFEGSGLTQLVLPHSVTSVGASAFYNCDSLVSVVIGDGLYSLGTQCFAGCDALTGIFLEASLTSLHIGSNEVFKYLTGIRYSSALTQYINASGHATIPNGIVTMVGSMQFYRSTELLTITLPATIVAIRPNAFLQSALETVVVVSYNGTETTLDGVSFRTSVYSEWAAAMIVNPAISSLIVNTDVAAHLVDGTGHANIPGGLDETCAALGPIGWFSCGGSCVLRLTPGGALCSHYAAVGSEAFKDRADLTSVSIPSSLTRIETRAFHFQGSGITSIVIPDSVESTGACAFLNCDSLVSVVIGDGLRSLDDRIFENCNVLSDVYLGASLTSIGSIAFYQSTGMTIMPENRCTALATTVVNRSPCVYNRHSIDLQQDHGPLHVHVQSSLFPQPSAASCSCRRRSPPHSGATSTTP